jgi:hypothetical protein
MYRPSAPGKGVHCTVSIKNVGCAIPIQCRLISRRICGQAKDITVCQNGAVSKGKLLHTVGYATSAQQAPNQRYGVTTTKG